MADNQRGPEAGRQERRDNTTDDDLNRENITPGEPDAERERGHHGTGEGERQPTDPDSAFADVDRDDMIDE